MRTMNILTALDTHSNLSLIVDSIEILEYVRKDIRLRKGRPLAAHRRVAKTAIFLLRWFKKVRPLAREVARVRRVIKGK